MIEEESEFPILAPCKKIEFLAPLHWLSLGWQDCKRAPKHSAIYGTIVVIISYFIFSMAWYFNSITLALGLLSAFIFVAPILCIGLYSIARQLKRDKPIDFRKSVRHGIRPYGDLLIFVIIMMVISLVWARSASMIHIFVPVNPDAGITDLSGFLGFIIIVPLLGYSTWHGYRESLDVEAWDDRINEFSKLGSDT